MFKKTDTSGQVERAVARKSRMRREHLQWLERRVMFVSVTVSNGGDALHGNTIGSDLECESLWRYPSQ